MGGSERQGGSKGRTHEGREGGSERASHDDPSIQGPRQNVPLIDIYDSLHHQNTDMHRMTWYGLTQCGIASIVRL